jgi:tricorn protease
MEDGGSGSFTRLSELQGNITTPMWLGERVYFLSDFEGTGNLYSCAPDGSALRRHTQHQRTSMPAMPPATASASSTSAAAELWLYDPARTARAGWPSTCPARAPRPRAAQVPLAEHLHNVALHPAGHSLALEARGQIFSMALWEGAVRQHGSGPARRRLAQWLADGQTLVSTSDASGEEQIEALTAAAHAPCPGPGPHHRDARRAAGHQLAMANHRNELWVGNVASGTLQRVDHSGSVASKTPCGRPAASGWPTPCPPARATRPSSCTTCQRPQLLATQPEFRDYAPAFDPEGKYLYFLSLRTYDPVYDACSSS